MLLRLDITQPHLPWLLSGNLHHWFSPELAYLGAFDLIVEAGELARSPAGRELLDTERLGRWSRLQWRGLITVLTSVAPPGPTPTQRREEGGG